ncbi:MAG: DUF3298 and DUF4163 domain-containing protein [Bryobacteraceae bacterium]|nr:DUF3298 and DUF4163 domain-containing protein [Bryobacteraceae bacterium]
MISTDGQAAVKPAKRGGQLFHPVICVVVGLLCIREEISGAESPSIFRPGYWHLRGHVGTSPVVMDIVDGNAYYSYDRYGEPITLVETQAGASEKRLCEENSNRCFEGRQVADGSFRGVWRDPQGKRSLPFSLRPTADVTVRLKYVVHSNKTADRETAFSRLVPYDAKWAPLLNDFWRDVLGSSLGGIDSTGSPAVVARRVHDSFYEATKDETSECGSRMSSMVLWNKGGLLSIGYVETTYSGGAHPNQDTYFASFDGVARKRIYLSDLFVDGSEKEVLQAYERVIRRELGLRPEEPIPLGPGGSGTVPLTGNFALTPRGILFIYLKYEIAPGAAGDPSFFLPFEDVKPWLKIRPEQFR